MADLVDTRLGQYELKEVVRRGGMATVYKAWQPALNRFVAVKVLAHTADPSITARFQLEARSIAALQHPNILPVYDFGEQDGILYLVGQLVEEGKTLSDEMAEPVGAAHALQIVGRVLAALGYSHSHGVIHRDIKPGNVLMPAPTWPVLADFGIVKILNDRGDQQLTQHGLVVGTAAYMAPEQAFGMTVDERTDLYSVGVVLYELVTGKVPFEADTPVATLAKHAYEPPPPAREVNPNVPPGIEQILDRALAKEPAGRYSSAAEMAADVERLLVRMEAARASGELRKLYDEGLAAFGAGRWAEAVAALDQLVTVDPEYRDANELLTSARHALRISSTATPSLASMPPPAPAPRVTEPVTPPPAAPPETGATPPVATPPAATPPAAAPPAATPPAATPPVAPAAAESLGTTSTPLLTPPGAAAPVTPPPPAFDTGAAPPVAAVDPEPAAPATGAGPTLAPEPPVSAPQPPSAAPPPPPVVETEAAGGGGGGRAGGNRRTVAIAAVIALIVGAVAIVASQGGDDTPTAAGGLADAVGQAEFSSRNGDYDVASLAVTKLPQPPDGKAWHVWYYHRSDGHRLDGGTLEVDASGQGRVAPFVDPAGRILPTKFDALEVTLEPVPDPEPQVSSGDVRYFDAIPDAAVPAVNGLLGAAEDTPANVAYVLGLRRAALQVRDRADRLTAAASAGDADAARAEAEAIANAISGEEGQGYGDLDGDGTTQSAAADGFGVASWASGTKRFAQQAATAGASRPSLATNAKAIVTAVTAMTASATQLAEQATALASDGASAGQLADRARSISGLAAGLTEGSGSADEIYTAAGKMTTLFVVPGKNPKPDAKPKAVGANCETVTDHNHACDGSKKIDPARQQELKAHVPDSLECRDQQFIYRKAVAGVDCTAFGSGTGVNTVTYLAFDDLAALEEHYNHFYVAGRPPAGFCFNAVNFTAEQGYPQDAPDGGGVVRQDQDSTGNLACRREKGVPTVIWTNKDLKIFGVARADDPEALLNWWRAFAGPF